MSRPAHGVRDGHPYSREQFQARRDAVRAVERREGRLLVVASVGLGFAQLALLAWADAHLSHPAGLRLEGSVFVGYLVLVAVLLWRFQTRIRAVRPTCSACGAVLEGISERIAVASGRCDACGGQVIA